MTTNQALAIEIAESLLEALPIRFGTTHERQFITKAAFIIAEKLDDCINQKSPQDEGLIPSTGDYSPEHSG
jgi:hypothetical protein